MPGAGSAEPVARVTPVQPIDPGGRFDRLDALRGFAIVWMATFHFGFDLAHFNLIDADFYRDRVWIVQRTVIVSLFLFCAGFGQALSVAQGQSWRRFWKRWAQVALCAVLVSLGSAIMFPKSWISFGVLHGIAVMLIVCRLTAGWGRWLWALGLLAIVLPDLVRNPLFDTRATNWVGLVTRKPRTEDWVPLLPWLGVMWWGLAAGRWVVSQRAAWVAGPLPRALGPLAVLGRWSLTFYMVHQPVLIGALVAWMSLQGIAVRP
jgi:uncharacterized membrane protein